MYVIIMSHTSFRVNPHSTVCLNVKELLARSRHHICGLSDSTMIRIHNHLVLNEHLTLASLVKWLSVRLQTKWFWVQIMLLSLKDDNLEKISQEKYQPPLLKTSTRIPYSQPLF